MTQTSSSDTEASVLLAQERRLRFAETAALTRLAEAQRQRLAELEGQAARLRADKEALLTSTSWRITAPIRWLITRLR